MKKLVGAAIAACLVASPALAERRLQFQAVEQEGGTLRFEQGVPTLDVQRERGAVQMTPLGLDHGRLTFAVSAVNLGSEPDNFGIEDITVTVQGQTIQVMTRQALERRAQRRAMWGQIAVGLAAGLGAAAEASRRDTYTATTWGRGGTYRTRISAPSIAGQINANNIARDGAYAMADIQARLDATRAQLANEIVQTTTVDPDDSYGGRFVINKLRGAQARFPQTVNIVVRFNGEDYPFAFNVTQAR